MIRKLIIVILTLGAVGRSSLCADPILLASYDRTIRGGGRPGSDPYFQIGLEIRADMPCGGYHCIVFGSDPDWVTPFDGVGFGVWWGPEEAGSVEFMATNDAGFVELAALATNGIDDNLYVWIVWPHDSGYVAQGYGGTESMLLTGWPDLSGYQLDLVRLTVHDLHIEPYEWPDGIGWVAQPETTWEFHGTPIPEPPTLTLWGIGLFAVFHREFRRRVSTCAGDAAPR